MTRANNDKQEELRKRIFDFKNLYQYEPNSFIANNFLAEGVTRSTIIRFYQEKKIILTQKG